MFSYLLSGRLGEFMAPRPSSNQEIWSLLKAAMFDKVLVEIKKPNCDFDINSLDTSSGMTIMHYACAGGSVELVAELLSRGADITVPSTDGNNALHFAAINNRKGIIEILLRSGGDPSVPNHSGLLPIELTKSKDVKELFLRDRSNIFSPMAMAQSRAMISEYVKAQTPTHSKVHPPNSASTASSAESSDSSKLPVFNMASEFEKENEASPSSGNSSNDAAYIPNIITTSPPLKLKQPQPMSPTDLSAVAPYDILSPLNNRSKHPPSRLHQDRHSDSASMSDNDDYTIVGVASVKKPSGTARPNLFRESSTTSTGSDILPSDMNVRLETSLPSTPTISPVKTGVPKLNLTQLAPPPIDPIQGVVSYSVSGIPSARGNNPNPYPRPSPTTAPPLILSARRGSGGSDREPNPGSPTNKGSSSINFYQPDTGLPVNTLILSPSHSGTHWGDGAGDDFLDSDSHSLFTDYNSNNNRSASHRKQQQALTNSHHKRSNLSDTNLSVHSGSNLNMSMFSEDDADEVHKAVVQAATETALSFQSSRDEYEARRLVVRNCQKLNEKSMRKLLAFDPSLAISRASDLGALAPDGQTPLHVAASFGNIEALQILLEMGASSGANCWVRDMQGRTPLHVAAEKGKKECCEFLRAQMKLEKKDPIGVDAPTDLAGTTPLGWASIGSKGKPKTGVESFLFKAGDRSILPLTPHSIRAGKSPWKTIQNQQERENLIFAFSEANGWTPLMEDRVLISCPVVNHASWSLFGVFDGHGGSFCSSFLAAGIPSILARESTIIASQHHCTDHDISGEVLTQLLTNICVSADEELSKHPRMTVEKSETGKITCLDSSGSTGVMALLTSKLMAVANVGDSRAVLAVRQSALSPIPNDRSIATVSTPGTHQHTLEGIIVSTPIDVDGSSPLDHLTASIERLNPNLSTPTSATPVHHHYSHSHASPSASGIAASYMSGYLQAVEMSHDHKAYLPEEKARAEAAGAIVEQVPNSSAYQMSMKGTDVKLRMSRSFGDFYLKQNSSLPADKQAVIAVPEVIIHQRDSQDAFLVLACDGIYDVMTNQEVVDFFGEKLGFTGPQSPVITSQLAAEACDALLSECLTRGTVDNISVILIVLGAAAPHTPFHPPHSVTSYYNQGTSSAIMGSAQRRHSHSTDPHGSAIRSSHSSEMLHHHIPRSPRDYDVDIPINSGVVPHISKATPLHVFQPTSLSNVFSNVAAKSIHAVVSTNSLSDSDGSDAIASPLNTAGSLAAAAHHNGRVRKQLQFNDDS